ncbi:CapA family protein [Merdibacter massiliensis]|uniref:CapA family protein n=1 Tax=Merdibacter massiliensis TaxID=1871030 RepID=UPI00096AB3CA|nr:CapA family protein [Merdibacter massiliensis]
MKKCKIALTILSGILVLSGCQMQHTDEKKEPEIKQDQKVSLTFTGDLLFEQSLYDSWENDQFGDYFDRIKPYLQGDIVVGNQEVPIAGEDLGISGVAYSFNAPDWIAPQLADVGFDVLTMSNNHVYDRGYEGVYQTLENLENSGITAVGLYPDEKSAEDVTVIEKNGIRIAFLAYTYDTNIPIEQKYAFVTKTFLNDAGQFDKEHQQMLKEDVEKARSQTDAIVVSMHWGREFTFELNEAQKQAAAYLNDLGVDLIIGNHPHCLQTMQRLVNQEGKETMVFYSLGNLVSAAAMVDRASVDFANLYEMGAIVHLNVVKDGESGKIRIEQVHLTPYINHFDVNYSHFQLIPFSEYTEKLAQEHCQRQYANNFTKEWLQEQLNFLFERKVQLDL